MVGPDDSTPRVFISYARDPASDAIRKRLEDALREAGFEHWLVPPAQQVQAERDEYLRGARAAVAIVSPLALESEWMRHEAALLARRASDDPEFRLVAMTNGEVPREALAELAEFAVDDGLDVDAQIAQVLARLAGLRSAAPAGGGGGQMLRAGAHEGGVHALALVTLDGRPCVVTGDGVGTLRVIEIATDTLRLELRNMHSGFVSAIAVGVLAGVPVAVSGGYDGFVRVLDLVDARVVGAQQLQPGGIGGLALLDVSPGPLAVAGGNDGAVQAWNLTRGEIGERAAAPGHEGGVRSVAATTLGGRPVALSGGDDRRVRLWDLASLTPQGDPWRGHSGAVLALAATTVGGRAIALSGGSEGTLRRWDLETGAPLGEPLQAHDQSILAIAVVETAGGPVAVTADLDGAIRAWDLRTDEPLGEPLRGDPGGVGALAAGAVGGRLAIVSGGADGSVRVWGLPGAASAPAAEPDDRVEWVSDARAELDLLQRRPLAAALATRLRRLREDEPGRSFLIHVDGRWGSGKSTLLDLMRKELADDWLVVDFDAWRQMRVGPPWWALLASLRHAVRRDLGALDSLRLRFAESWQRVRRGGALYVVAVGILLAIALAVLIAAGVDLGAADEVVGGVLALTAALYAAMSAVGRFLLWDSAAGARVFELSHRDPMESVADHFAWLIARAGKPVVFFVDDVDRCANEYVVDLLDSIQTLVRDAPQRLSDGASADRACHVVVAADGRWIRTSYEYAHGEFAGAVEEPGRPLGYLFLDKIFQLTVPVPAISPQRQADYLQALLRVEADGAGEQQLGEQASAVARQVEESDSEAEALEAYGQAPADVRAAVAGTLVGKLAEPQIEQATRHRLERYAGLLETNPRAMKLVLNAYGMARALQVIEDNVVPGDALALWTILRVRWPALADHLQAHPETIEPFAAGAAPPGTPPAIARLFDAPAVRRVVDCTDGGPLTAATIRACCGVPEDAALSRPPRAGTP